MAISRNSTASTIKPLQSALRRRYVAGAAIAAGEIVAMQADGKVDPADASSAVPQVVGVAIQAATAENDPVDVVTFGPVTSIAGGTPAANVFVSGSSAGEPVESAPTYATRVGWVEAAGILFVNPTSDYNAVGHTHA